ncbi:hypothetical protein NKI19_27890 [Mesorhizobium sp. M0751]|uniref:hypothetical protein n=1 Tax=unclassified Mesorhizobium TaxID=325217 RepID=UPI0033374F23
MSNFDPSFLLACLICGGIFFAFVFIHSRWLREHTKDWVRCAAEVLDRIEGGDGPDRYLLKYEFDGTVYRVETSPWLVPVCTAKAGSQITVLINPYNPHQCASRPRGITFRSL